MAEFVYASGHYCYAPFIPTLATLVTTQKNKTLVTSAIGPLENRGLRK
ncbi:MAG: hypothetical protein WBJ03_02255 [Moraxellaceae bacterium]